MLEYILQQLSTPLNLFLLGLLAIIVIFGTIVTVSDSHTRK